MKNFILGMIVMGCLIVGGTVVAQEVENWIGKSIEGQFPVTVDGVQLKMPAAVIDGRTFLPVRAFGEATGYHVSFNSSEGEVIMRKVIKMDQLPPFNIGGPANESNESNDPNDPNEPGDEVVQSEANIQRAKKSIEEFEEYIEINQTIIRSLEEEISDLSKEQDTPSNQHQIDAKQRELKLKQEQNKLFQERIAEQEQKISEYESVQERR